MKSAESAKSAWNQFFSPIITETETGTETVTENRDWKLKITKINDSVSHGKRLNTMQSGFLEHVEKVKDIVLKDVRSVL